MTNFMIVDLFLTMGMILGLLLHTMKSGESLQETIYRLREWILKK